MFRVAGPLLSPLLNQELQICKALQRFLILLQRGLPASYPVHKWQGNITCPVLQHYRIPTEYSQVSLPLSLYNVKASLSKH